MSGKSFLLAAVSVAGSSQSGAAAALLAQSVLSEQGNRPVDSLTLERTGKRSMRIRRDRGRRITRVLRVLVKAAA